MTYASQEQLVARFGAQTLVSLTDRAVPPTGEIDTAVVAQALADTDAMIDGYLAGRYQLPLVDVPALLRDPALAIAIYKLHTFAPDPKIKDDYELALKQLRDISSGVIKLGVAGVEPAGTGAGGVQMTDRERPLTQENLTGFI